MANFDKFLRGIGKQEERTDSKIKVEVNPILEQLVEIYEGWLKEQSQVCYGNDCKLSMDKTKGLGYSSRDITSLCLRLKIYESHKYFDDSGVFLSALINNCNDAEFLLITLHLNKKLNFIGYKNTKKIIVKGCTQNWAGLEMSGGIIIVEENTKDFTGNYMSDGNIIIKGKTGENTGSYMTGGVIRVAGKIESISELFVGGKIYCENKLIRS